jgi:hypothetical protein
MSRQHVEIIDGKEYTVTTLPQESRVAPLTGRPEERVCERLV